MTQQTAIEWLEEELAKNLKHIVQNADSDLMESLFEQAKKMEKEQIIEAFKAGAFHPGYELESQQYYWINYENKP